MRKYIVRDSEAGNIIDRFNTVADALNAIEVYEADDKADGIYEEGFYEIVKENVSHILGKHGIESSLKYDGRNYAYKTTGGQHYIFIPWSIETFGTPGFRHKVGRVEYELFRDI